MSHSFSGYSRGCGVQIQSVLVWILIIFFSGVTTTTDYNSRHYSQPLVSYWTVNAVCVCAFEISYKCRYIRFFFSFSLLLFSRRVCIVLCNHAVICFFPFKSEKESERERERTKSVCFIFVCWLCCYYIFSSHRQDTYTNTYGKSNSSSTAAIRKARSRFGNFIFSG